MSIICKANVLRFQPLKHLFEDWNVAVIHPDEAFSLFQPPQDFMCNLVLDSSAEASSISVF